MSEINSTPEEEFIREDAEQENSGEIVQDEPVAGENVQDGSDSGENVQEGSAANEADKKPFRSRAPLIIAACVLISCILFFAGWKCFFDTSVKGCWGISVASVDGGKNQEYTLTFNDDDTVRYHRGSVTYTGRYNIRKNESGQQVIKTYFNTYYGVNENSFEFRTSGNILTGRHLYLTDCDGLLMPPTTKDDSAELPAEISDIVESVEKDDKIYYVFDFVPMSENNNVDPIKDAAVDEKLVGSWLYSDKDRSEDDFTVSFKDDGSFVQVSHYMEFSGRYSAADGKCTLRSESVPGQSEDQDFTYTIKDDELEFNGVTFKKTDDPCSFKSKDE